MNNHLFCQCCGHLEMKIIGQIVKYDQLLCEKCEYVRFLNHSNVVSQFLYESDNDYNDDLNVANDFNDLIHWNHNKALQYLKVEYPIGMVNVLDIGCFNGFFVKKLLLSGFNAQGIDFNNKAIEFGRSRYGLDNFISNQTLQDLLRKKERFDVITLFEVVEHLEDISDILSKAYSLLNKNGIIIISVPNSNMCWRPALDFPPHHLSRFSPTSLRMCVKHFGFHIIKLHEQMSSYDLIRNYVGTFFREKNKASLRGGTFKNKESTRILRVLMNKLKRFGWIIFFPLDFIFYSLGVRYICQIVIARKH
jgi:2-polyprenyl-3-methyl-5-hydroxy-6-metoxy-1,4-benzoquinol methylase